MRNVGLGYLEPGKGYHFSDGQFVEYKGTIPQSEIQSKQKELELEANKLISEVSAAVLSYEGASELCGGCLPDYIPKGSTEKCYSYNKFCRTSVQHRETTSFLPNQCKTTSFHLSDSVFRLNETTSFCIELTKTTSFH
ncbi:uncharacterized protein LOC130757217 [Actinidia eriantha]|uniref:uncharacterized protein LOC130757217 n=1 Tax=Actinidia eriantha TaxID=165200 RepID=UPI0025907365|nr:uncharacterized protein LOC130757217 [Actinidia eriantha]